MVFSPEEAKKKREEADDSWNREIMEYTCKHVDGKLESGRTTINACDGFFIGGPGAPIERLASIPDLVRDSVIAAYGKRGWNIEIKCWTEGFWFFKRFYSNWVFTAK